jgi:hypothetical protein
MYSIFCQRHGRLPRRRAYQFFKYPDREFHQLPALCPLSFFVSFVHVGHAVDGEVEIVNAMQSLRVFVVPKNRKRREIAPEEKMSRDAIRQILAKGCSRKLARQNLAYCVSAPNRFSLA